MTVYQICLPNGKQSEHYNKLYLTYNQAENVLKNDFPLYYNYFVGNCAYRIIYKDY